MSTATPPMRVLDWDSEFFGFPIARVEPGALQPEPLERFRREHSIRCAYVLVDVSDHAALRAAAACGFRAVDVRVTMTARAAPPARPGIGVRAATAGDVEHLKAIARASHHDSRFYADGQFDRVRCDDLFARWIERSCEGWADRVLVTENDGTPAGYVTVHRRGAAGQIGLVGVHERARGKGAASALLAEARRWSDDQLLSALTVATQGGNRAALALYQSAGFDVTSIEIWYHRWFPTP